MPTYVVKESGGIRTARSIKVGVPGGRYSATGLPTGLSISEDGLITGTPTVGGEYVVTVTKSNAAGDSTATFTWLITIPGDVYAGTDHGAYPGLLYPGGYHLTELFPNIGESHGVASVSGAFDNGTRDLVGLAEGVGAATGALGADVGSVGVSVAGASVSGVTGNNDAVMVGTSAGVGAANAVRSSTSNTALAAGVATVTGVFSTSSVATLSNAFTYTAIDPSVATFAPRRTPSFQIQRYLNDAPDGCSYTSGVAIETGNTVVADFDGVEHFEGPIVRYDLDYEENTENAVWRATLTDYQWLLNRRRPFACYEDESVSVIVADLLTRFSTGFTGAGVEADLPAVSVVFDGSKSFTECLTQLCQMINATFRLNGKDLTLRVSEETTSPADVDDENMDLIRDPAIKMSKDITQIRNRVWGKGAGVVVTQDAAPGSKYLWVEGADLFTTGGAGGLRASLGGGQMIVGCQIFTYTGAEIVFIVAELPPAPAAATITPLNDVVGNVNKDVRYQLAVLREDTGESALSDTQTPGSFLDYLTVPPVFAGTPTDGGFCTGNVPDGTHRYMMAWRLTDGSLVMDVSRTNATREIASEGSTVFPLGSLPTVPASFDGVSPDLRAEAKVMFRTKLGDLLNYYEVEDVPLASTAWTDRLSDESLGDLAPTGLALSGSTLNGVSRGGVRYRLSGFPSTRIGMKIYRSEREYGSTTWSEFKLLVTLTSGDIDEYIDNTESVEFGDLAAEPESTARMRIIGIPASGTGALTERVKRGDTARIWAMEEDVDEQNALKISEGGDGIHEYEVPGLTGITRVADLRTRLQAELEVFAPPIYTVVYGTREETLPGQMVHIDLTDPPIGPFDLKVQAVNVDQVHEASGLTERYTVTASTMRFTLEDLLRRASLN